MIKNFLALACITTLAACSSGSNTPADTGNGSAGGGNPPTSDSRAGTYLGDFGSGTGVYVINDNNDISGLALASDGSAKSIFGNLGTGSTFTGNLREHDHVASATGNAGAFGPGQAIASTATYALNIVNGQTIESLSGPSVSLVGSTAGALEIASTASLAGNWSGVHQYCGNGGTDCNELVTTITFSGTAISGETKIVAQNGSESFQNPISGAITEFGNVSLLTFTWAGNTYDGLVYRVPDGSGRIVFIGETVAADANNKTIASLMSRN